MDLEKIKEAAYQHLASRKAHPSRETGFIYHHGQRVANLAVSLREQIAPRDSGHDQRLIVASWFHDIAKGIEPHSKFGALLVGEILAEYCDDNDLAAIAQIVAGHQFRKTGASHDQATLIVQDADILDHYGVVEIWMNFHYAAQEDRSLLDALAFYQQEYSQHAQEVRSLLNFPISTAIFDEKDRFVRAFVERMTIEAHGGWVETPEGKDKK